jgi:putative membrane protein insertion efficiency factor
MSTFEAAESGLRFAPKNLLLLLLRAYKRALSPIFLPSCRYVPTCSDYAAEAIEKFGAVRGTALAIWRLLRCHPFVRGGFDPVPASDICSHSSH